jgi:hypothetical protein
MTYAYFHKFFKLVHLLGYFVFNAILEKNPTLNILQVEREL